jgi:hypothetical protein|tara:strand:- start:1844 stop:2089 length:246 start_codon:yes stop_codon:yes gene_type:complete
MLNSEDFELKLEDQLRQRIINDEINKCTDINVLRDQLKQCSGLMMRYQHILNRLLREQITQNLEQFTKAISIDEAKDNGKL